MFSWDDLMEEPRPSGSQLVYPRCPECGASFKLYVNPETGAWFCFAGGHNRGGRLPARAGERIIFPVDRKAGTVPAWDPIEIPDVRPLTAEALAYLARRGIDPQAARAFGLCESGQFPDRIVVPFFWNGELVYWTSRAYGPGAIGPKYVAAPGRHPLYVLLALEPKPVVVEGVFDAMQVAMAGLPAIALCGKSLPQYLEPMMKQLVEHSEVYIMLDRDAVGDAVKLAERIDQFAICTRILVPTAKDPGDMTPGDIRKLVLSRAA